MAPPKPPFKSFETVNFYSGGTLNRLSWLRTESHVLNAFVQSPQARFVVLKNLNPLVHKEGEKAGYLATMSWDEVKEPLLQSADASGRKGQQGNALFGPEAYGIQQPSDLSKDDEQAYKKATSSMGATGIALVFLGIDESGQAVSSLPGQLAGADSSSEGIPAGIPYFALSLSYRPKGTPADQQTPLQELSTSLETSGKYDFVDTRTLGKAGQWPMQDAALVAQARALVDWNERNHFCPACSRRQYSVWGGYKRSCVSALTKVLPPSAYSNSLTSSSDDDNLGECFSTTTLSNFCYPRTDPVVIMGVLSPDGEKLLLGRQRKWPPGFWSCLAGFIESGESLEEAVRREVLEEAGVPVCTVVYHSSQTWPFPCQLMMGCFGIAEADPNSSDGLPAVRTDLDNELESAQWYTRDEILAVLEDSARAHLSRHQVERMDDAQNKADPSNSQKDPGSIANTAASSSSSVLHSDQLKVPPATAIAHVLISAWARREAVLPTISSGAQGQSHQAKV